MKKEPFDARAAIREVQAMCDRYDARFGKNEAKLETHDDLLTTMVRMLTNFEKTQGEHGRRLDGIDARLDGIDEKLYCLDAKIDLRFEQMQSDFRAFKEVLLDHSLRIQRLEKKVG
jgi:hypothetical protein